MSVREWVEYEYSVVEARSLEELCERLSRKGPVRIVYVEKGEEQHYDERVVVYPVRIVYVEKGEEQHYDERVVVYKAVVEREIRVREEVKEVA